MFPLCIAALGFTIIRDFHGFATWHRRQAEASTPAVLRKAGDKLVGRERNDRAKVVIQKVVGWAFMVVGLFIATAIGIDLLLRA